MSADTRDEYGKRTLEFVAAVQKATSSAEITHLVIGELAWYGLTFMTSWSMPHESATFLECFDANTRPASYVEHYVRDNLLWRDPVISAMRATLAPLTWADVMRDFSLSKAERGTILEAKDFGATDGLTIPVLGENGAVGVFSPCGWKPDLSPRARSALELVGLYAHQALQRQAMKEARKVATHEPLTPREREIMRWVAIGKTNDEIGDILGIALQTVKTLLARAQVKLNSTRRTYAVVQALRLGELDMNF